MMAWQPVEDGEYTLPTGHILNVCFAGVELEQWHLSNLYKDGSPKDVEEITLGDYRLCRQVPDAASVPVEVVEAIATWIDGAALPYGLSDDERDYFMSQKKIARAWLEQMKGGE